MSGFTTTGSSILSDVEALPDSLLFWRSLTHWLGGRGIVLLMVAVLPLVGTGGMLLYRAEFSGAMADKIKARVGQAAFSLWKIYVGFSIAGYVALRWVGMEPLDAVCHMFGAIATGGFSTRSASVEAYHSASVEMVLVALMIAGGMNFTQHYRLLVMREGRRFVADAEIRFYLGLLAAAICLVAFDRLSVVHFWEALRQAMFQVTSIMTATGFSSADFGQWSPLSQLTLLALMYAGGCTGSTAGGLKSARIALLIKVIRRQFKTVVERRGVFTIRLGRSVMDEWAVRSLLSMILLALIVDFGATLILTATGVDVMTAISAVPAVMFNVGPGLGAVGPASNYGHLPLPAKWTLIACMLIGRLEFYVALVVFTPAFWRR